MQKFVILALFIILFLQGCKNTTTGQVVVDIKENETITGSSINETNQSYYVNRTIDLAKDARIIIIAAEEKISDTKSLFKTKIDSHLIGNERRQRAEKLINNAELLIDKAKESYSKDLYENSMDLALEARVKTIEAESVINK